METKIRILAADPNADFCRQLGELCTAEGDMELVGASGDGQLHPSAALRTASPPIAAC